MELHDLDLAQLQDAIATRAIGPDEVVEHAVERAHSIGHLNAFTEIVESPRPAGDGPLRGVPIVVKDMFVDHDRVPTMGSNLRPTGMRGTAVVLDRLRAAGARVIGYTNLHEWGLGMSSEVTATGPIRNPWDASLAPGGSSGGTAAAVAAGVAPAGIGTDAGGSIRCPSALCQVVGFKPTWGAVPMSGFAEGEGAIDHIGPIARTVRDARTIFEVLSATTTDRVDPGDLRVGVARRHFCDDLDPAFSLAFERGVEAITGLVSEVREVEVPSASAAAWAVGYLLLPHTAALLGSTLDREGGALQEETRALVRVGAEMLGAHPCGANHLHLIDRMRKRTSTRTQLRFPDMPRPIRSLLRKHFYNEAQGELARAQISSSFARAFEQVDVIVTPTVPARPPKIGGRVVTPAGESSADKAYLPLLGPMNLAGIPSLTVPCGDAGEGWVAGALLTGAKGADGAVLSLGEALEDALGRIYRNRVAAISS